MIFEAGWQTRHIEFDELFKESNISELFTRLIILIILWIENFLMILLKKNVKIFFLL